MSELPDPEPSPEEIRAAADEILSRAEFQPAQPSIFERIADWFGDIFGGLFDNFQPSMADGSGSPIFGYLILTAALVGIGYLVWRVVRRARRDPEVDDEPIDPDDARSAADWRGAAEQCEAEGRWKDALRCRYRVLVGALVEREAIPDVPGRTAGEYRTEVSTAFPDVGPPFAEATDLFELAWYADEPTGPDENARFRSLTENVLEQVR